MVTLGLSPAAMSWRRAFRRSSHQNSLHVRGVEAPPLLDGRQGLPRLAPVEHARRLPLQHPLHGPVHVAVPSKARKHTVRRSFSAGS